MPKRIFTGVVVSNKADKTISVEVEKVDMHKIYKKIIKRRKKYTAHDPENTCSIGDLVKIVECRPISKSKKWLFLEKIGVAAS